MDKAHEVSVASLQGTILRLRVDGKDYEVDIARHSPQLANATPEQRANYEISAVGYGIHWPALDEDLSIDRLIGVRHAYPLTRRTA